MNRRFFIPFILLLMLAAVAAWLSVRFGGSATLSGTGTEYIFNEIRIPKTVTAFMAGAALAISGLVLQVLFRNPLAGPYVLGISSGASLMVAIVILGTGLTGLTPAKSVIAAAAVTGSLAVTILTLSLARKVRSGVVLLVTGLMIGQILSAIETGLEYFADPGSLKLFVMWGFGSLSNTTNSDLWVLVPVVAATLLTGVAILKPLNGLLLGEAYAANAGVHVKGARIACIIISSVLTGTITAYCGPIAFIGITVPIISRMVFNTSRQEIHYVSCILAGGTLLMLADAASHMIKPGAVLPVNMITTVIGAPLVLWLMFKRNAW
jgi:iron complex transport system permease protein